LTEVTTETLGFTLAQHCVHSQSPSRQQLLDMRLISGLKHHGHVKHNLVNISCKALPFGKSPERQSHRGYRSFEVSSSRIDGCFRQHQRFTANDVVDIDNGNIDIRECFAQPI
jgi:hypothetical protein